MTTTSRTEHLLARMTEGDDMFNARDFTGLDQVHHPDMIAYMTGLAQPIYGRAAHSKAMKDLVESFPDIRVHTPYPIQFATGKAFDLEFGQTSSGKAISSSSSPPSGTPPCRPASSAWPECPVSTAGGG